MVGRGGWLDTLFQICSLWGGVAVWVGYDTLDLVSIEGGGGANKQGVGG